MHKSLVWRSRIPKVVYSAVQRVKAFQPPTRIIKFGAVFIKGLKIINMLRIWKALLPHCKSACTHSRQY